MPRTLALLSLALLTPTAGFPAADWNQWRGPSRTGAAGPIAPPARLEKVWSVEIGTGHSSPLVVGDRAYQFSRIDDREALTALELATGEVAWRSDYEAPYRTHMAALGHGKGPKSTPVVGGGRIFTLGIGGVLSAFDAAGGRRLWQRDFSDRWDATSPTYGAAMSPLLDGKRLVAHVGGPAAGSLSAFDVETGREIWSWTGDAPGYASPVVAELDGERQLVTFSRRHLVGLDPASGRLLWSLPFVTDYDQNAVTPLVRGRFVIVSGLDRGTSAIRPTRRGASWTAETIWHTDAVAMYLSSPVPAGDRVCGLSHQRKGQLFCLDPESGRVHWTSEGRIGDYAALIAADRWVWALTDGAELVLFDADDDGYRPTAVWEVADSETWAHPVLLPDGLLIKDKTRLTRWRFVTAGGS